jgi:hypothetical protein
VGALRLCIAEGVAPTHIIGTIADAFRFKGADPGGAMLPADVKFHAELEAKGLEGMLAGLCGLGAQEYAGVVADILAMYRGRSA